MSDLPDDDLDDLDEVDRLDDPDRLDAIDELEGLGLEETALDRTRTDYTGAVLDDEFQPVDELELEEEGLQLDDPET